MCSQLSLSLIVTYQKVAVNTELVNDEPLLIGEMDGQVPVSL